jgi:hypothetical protein
MTRGRGGILVVMLIFTAIVALAEPAVSGGGNPPLNTGEAPWARPNRLRDRVEAAGLEMKRTEQLDYHVHAHLDVFVDGEHEVVPGGIGISRSVKPRDFDGETLYVLRGGRCSDPCISPLHTHDDSGVLHTESPIAQPNTLGEFFTEWGVRLTETCVGGYCEPSTPIGIYLDGEEFVGDPREIELTDLLEVAIVIGTPPPEIPSTGDFSRA